MAAKPHVSQRKSPACLLSGVGNWGTGRDAPREPGRGPASARSQQTSSHKQALGRARECQATLSLHKDDKAVSAAGVLLHTPGRATTELSDSARH